MSTGIHIDGAADAKSVESITEGITKVLRAGHDTHADQATIVKALDALSQHAGVSHVNINNNVIKSED